MKPVGDGTRALNFLIDTILIFTLSFFVYKWWNFQVKYWGYHGYSFGRFFFGSLFIYYTFFETIFARTPAKWFTFTKVVNQKGGKPSILQILIRSLTRLTLIDLFFLPILGKTLHDHFSKTLVIEK